MIQEIGWDGTNCVQIYMLNWYGVSIEICCTYLYWDMSFGTQGLRNCGTTNNPT